MSGQLIFLVYVFFAGILVLFSFSHLYHAIRFGGRDPLMITTTGIFIAGLIVILIVSFSLLLQVNWSSPVNVTLPSFQYGSIPDVNSVIP